MVDIVQFGTQDANTLVDLEFKPLAKILGV